MQKILIIHPEGNIKNNPNLFALTRLIVQKGWEVVVYSRKRPEIYQGTIFDGASFVYFQDSIDKTLQLERSFKQFNFSFIIGVDDLGIYKAKCIADFLQLPYLFLSYEILFDDEISRIGCKLESRYKRLAKISAKNAICAITQDEQRKHCLSIEYGIPLQDIILMPVANTESHQLKSTLYFHKSLNISTDKHILLYMGWMDAIQEKRMLDFAKYIPDSWVLVAHSRYAYKSTCNSELIGSKLFFSFDKPVENLDDMGLLLSDVDAGFCTYKPSFDSIYTGKNIEYIGMSSGKTTTFLQYGVPVVIENMNIWDKLVKKYDIGFELKSSKDLQKLDSLIANDSRKNSIDFFDQNLDANLYFPPIWNIIHSNCRKSLFSSSHFLIYAISEYFYLFKVSLKNYIKLLIKELH